MPLEARLPVALAFLNLLAAAGLGMTLAVNKVSPFLPVRHLDAVFAHAHLAGLGWGTLMVMGAGYRMLPMILPAAMPRGVWVYASTVLVQVGVTGLVAGFLSGGRGLPASALVAAAGVVVFLSRVVWMLQNRRPAPAELRRPDWGAGHALQAMLYLLAALALGVHLAAAPPSEAGLRLAMAYGVVGLVGFLSQIVVGVGGRLLPLFGWLWGFADRGHAESPPSLHAAPVRTLQALVFGLWTLGVPLLAGGLALDRAGLVSAGAGGLFVAVLANLANIATVLARLRHVEARGQLEVGRFQGGLEPSRDRLALIERGQKQMKGANILAFVLLLGSPSAILGEEVPVSLAEALELAGQRNPEILAQRARTDAEAAQAAVAARAGWPRLSVSTGWSRTDTPSMVFAQKLNAGDFTQDDFAIGRLNAPDALSHLTATLVAEVPVDLFGKLKARTQAQSSHERATSAELEEAVQGLRLRVVEAYRRAALARRVAEVGERALASARAREAQVEARVAEGAALRADLLRVRARRRQREAELAERRADAQIADAMLARALGAGPGVSYRPTEMALAPKPLEGDGGSWTSRALAAREALRAANERRNGQTWSVRAEGRSNRPDLAAWGQVQDDRSGFTGGSQSGALGVLLRWSVFDPARGKRVAVASAAARAAELDARGAAAQVRLEVETAWRQAQAARERHAAAVGGAEEGREALRVVQERREQGMATLTDELETEAASLFAELEELRAAAQAAIADAALLRAAGAL